MSCLWVFKLTRFCTSHSLPIKVATWAHDPIWQTDDALAGPSHAHLGLSQGLFYVMKMQKMHWAMSTPFDVGLKMAVLQTTASEPRIQNTPTPSALRTFCSWSLGNPRLWSTALRDASCAHGGSPSSSEIPQDMQCASVEAGSCCDICETLVYFMQLKFPTLVGMFQCRGYKYRLDSWRLESRSY